METPIKMTTDRQTDVERWTELLTFSQTFVQKDRQIYRQIDLQTRHTSW